LSSGSFTQRSISDYTCYCPVGNGEYNNSHMARTGSMEDNFELLAEWEEFMKQYEQENDDE